MNIGKIFSRQTADKPQAQPQEDPGLWRPDVQLRSFTFHPYVHEHELMAADFREILNGMDEYNAGRDENSRVSIEVHAALDDFLERYIQGTAPRSQLGGVWGADGLRMHVGGTMYEAVYFNDMVYNSGLKLYRPGAEKKSGEFLCGLAKPMDFGSFIGGLQAPVAQAAPAVPAVSGWRKLLGLGR